MTGKLTKSVFVIARIFVNCKANEKWTDIKLRTGVFVFVQFSERKDAVESFMVAGKKVVKLDQIYFWFIFYSSWLQYVWFIINWI